MTRHHLLITAALVAMPFSAHAQTTASPLLACFVPKSGTMYVVGQPGAPDKCRSTDHVLLQWNTVGPAGPAGAAGAVGPQGPAGPAGAATLTGSSTLADMEYVVVERQFVPGDGDITVFLVATCPPGKVAIGGGLLGPSGFPLQEGSAKLPWIQFVGSYPNAAFGFSAREWVTQVQVTASISVVPRVKSVAICARVN